MLQMSKESSRKNGTALEEQNSGLWVQKRIENTERTQRFSRD
jgi:hypothetical protein